jgi:hypothetical protein
MRRIAMLLVAVTACALAPATASAALPRPASTAIVPGKSIGGVRIGMTVKSALAHWGAGSHCTAATIRRSCTWTGSGTQGTVAFNVGFTGKVRSITITAGHNERSQIYKGPLQGWKTSRGIHLGSSAASVVKAYPKVRSSPSGPQLGSGSRSTIFTKSARRISQIYIGPPF